MERAAPHILQSSAKKKLKVQNTAFLRQDLLEKLFRSINILTYYLRWPRVAIKSENSKSEIDYQK